MGEKIESKDIFLVILATLLGAALSRYVFISDNVIFNFLWLLFLAFLILALIWGFAYFFNKFGWGKLGKRK